MNMIELINIFKEDVLNHGEVTYPEKVTFLDEEFEIIVIPDISADGALENLTGDTYWLDSTLHYSDFESNKLVLLKDVNGEYIHLALSKRDDYFFVVENEYSSTGDLITLDNEDEWEEILEASLSLF